MYVKHTKIRLTQIQMLNAENTIAMHEHTIAHCNLPLKPGVHCFTIQSKPSLQYVDLLHMMKFYGKFTQDCGMPEQAPLRLEKLRVSS